MTSSRLLWSLAIGTVLVAGCKKDEEPPAPAKTSPTPAMPGPKMPAGPMTMPGAMHMPTTLPSSIPGVGDLPPLIPHTLPTLPTTLPSDGTHTGTGKLPGLPGADIGTGTGTSGTSDINK